MILFDFNPPNINSLMDSINEVVDYSEQFYDSFLNYSYKFTNESNKSNNNNICCICKKNKGNFYYTMTNQFLCKECINNQIIIKKSELLNIGEIDITNIDRENNIKLFLNSTKYILITILLMINTLLINEKN